MVKVLLGEVKRLGIPLLTSATIIKLLHQRDASGVDRVAGAILATGSRAWNTSGLAIVTAPNVVLATGGPGSCIATAFTHINVLARWDWRWKKGSRSLI